MQALGAIGRANGPLARARPSASAPRSATSAKEMRSEGTSVLSLQSSRHRRAPQLRRPSTSATVRKRYGADPATSAPSTWATPPSSSARCTCPSTGPCCPSSSSYVNSVTVTLRKDHANGEQTLRELVLDRGTRSSRASGDLRMVYGWNGDSRPPGLARLRVPDALELQGRRRAYETDWTKTNAPDDRPLRALRAPDACSSSATAEPLKAKGVRAVVVQLDYPFFGERRRPQLVVRPEDAIEEQAGRDHAAPRAAGLRLRDHLAAGGQQAADRQAPRRQRTRLRGRATVTNPGRNQMTNAAANPSRVRVRRATLRHLALWASASVWAAASSSLRLARAVVLDDENRLDVALKDSTHVTLFGEATSTPGVKTANYYYLPPNLHLSKRPDGTPEFLFLKFTTDARTDQGGVSGGLMHFLMEWGLTPEQEAELQGEAQGGQPEGRSCWARSRWRRRRVRAAPSRSSRRRSPTTRWRPSWSPPARRRWCPAGRRGGRAAHRRGRAAPGRHVREEPLDHRRLDRPQLRLHDPDAGGARQRSRSTGRSSRRSRLDRRGVQARPRRARARAAAASSSSRGPRTSPTTRTRTTRCRSSTSS